MLQNLNKTRKDLKIKAENADRHGVRVKSNERKSLKAMGMAASQGRLLFMTARLSNNEFEQQCVAYSKQRLADDSQTANDQYLEALSATQYQVITGYSGDTPTYEPVTYNQLTGLGNVATGKQYIVSDNTGKIVVSQSIASAFESAQGDYNKFLKTIEKGTALTQVSESKVTEQDVHNAWDEYFTSVSKGDKDGIYNQNETNHILGFTYHAGKNNNGGDDVPYCTYSSVSTDGINGGKNRIYLQEDSNGDYYYNNYAVQKEAYKDEDGNTKYRAYYVMSENLESTEEDRNLMQDSDKIYLKNVTVNGNGEFVYNDGTADKAVSTLYVDQDYGADINKPVLTTDDKWYMTKNSGTAHVNSDDTASNGKKYVENSETIFYEGSTAEQRQLYDYAMAISEKYANSSSLTYDADKVQYYTNIYNQMTTKGYTTFQEMVDNKYINTVGSTENNASSNVNDETGAFKSDEWLVNLLKQGKLSISFYSSTDKAFVATSLDDDESITEKENKSKMAIAEQAYNNHMDKIESEDKRFDMQLSKLDAEHTALQTEYESVAKVISKNVEKSFGTFNA